MILEARIWSVTVYVGPLKVFTCFQVLSSPSGMVSASLIVLPFVHWE